MFITFVWLLNIFVLILMWGFCEAGSSVYSLWVGARLALGLSTSFSGFAILTSLELWAEPPPRPTEGEFPIADSRSGWAKDYTWRQNWGDFTKPEKLGVELEFDLVRVSNFFWRFWMNLRSNQVDLTISGRTRCSGLGSRKRPSRNSRRKKDPDFTAESVLGRTLTWPNGLARSTPRSTLSERGTEYSRERGLTNCLRRLLIY